MSLLNRLDLKRHAPPGIELKYLKNTLAWGLTVAGFYSMGFLIRFSDLRRMIFEPGPVLKPGQRVPEFYELIVTYNWDPLIIFRILIPCMLAFTIYHYLYCRTGSMSVYLLRRLPKRWEYHRRCWALPVGCALLVFAVEVLFLLLYFGIYVWTIPDEYLTPGQFAAIWRVLL